MAALYRAPSAELRSFRTGRFASAAERAILINGVRWTPFFKMARPAGLEPATTNLEGWCSIQMSYGRGKRRVFYTIMGNSLMRTAGASCGLSCTRRFAVLRVGVVTVGCAAAAHSGVHPSHEQIQILVKFHETLPALWLQRSPSSDIEC